MVVMTAREMTITVTATPISAIVNPLLPGGLAEITREHDQLPPRQHVHRTRKVCLDAYVYKFTAQEFKGSNGWIPFMSHILFSS